jgi:hypothetical protein
MNFPSKMVDLVKLALKPIELRIDSRLILLALLVGSYMYFSHKDARQQRIETVYAAGTHRITVLDTDKLSWNVYKDSVTGATIFCGGMTGFSCVILPPDKAK